MTVYERLCAYVSPRWYGYQDILDKRYDICEARIERSLPQTATDSYLGRLLSLSVCVNNTLSSLKADNFEAWIYIVTLITRCGVIYNRPLTTKMKAKVKEYFAMGLPASWIENLLGVFGLSFFSAKQYQELNKPEYLAVLKAVYAVRNTYEPVKKWFTEHPEAINEASEYKEAFHG